MDSVFLSTRYGSHRQVLRLAHEVLHSRPALLQALRTSYSISETADMEAFLLVASNSSDSNSSLVEILITDTIDLKKIKSGDVIVVRTGDHSIIRTVGSPLSAPKPVLSTPVHTSAPATGSTTAPSAITPALGMMDAEAPHTPKARDLQLSAMASLATPPATAGGPGAAAVSVSLGGRRQSATPPLPPPAASSASSKLSPSPAPQPRGGKGRGSVHAEEAAALLQSPSTSSSSSSEPALGSAPRPPAQEAALAPAPTTTHVPVPVPDTPLSPTGPALTSALSTSRGGASPPTFSTGGKAGSKRALQGSSTSAVSRWGSDPGTGAALDKVGLSIGEGGRVYYKDKGGKEASRLGLKDILRGQSSGRKLAPAAYGQAQVALASLVQHVVVREHGLEQVQLFGGLPPLLASSAWQTCSTLVLVVPDWGQPPCLWSAPCAALVGLPEASMGAHIGDLLGGGGVKGKGKAGEEGTLHHAGLLLLNPWAPGAGSGAGVGKEPSVEEGREHMRVVWQRLLEQTTAAKLLWLAHGHGCDLVLGLMSHPDIGVHARARTIGLGLLAPVSQPKQALAAAVAASGDIAARASTGAMRAWMRTRCVAWVGQQQGPPPGVQGGDGRGEGEAPGPHLVLHPQPWQPAAPAPSEEAGCWVQTCGVYMPGLAAYREEGGALCAGLTPALAREPVKRFLHALAEGRLQAASQWAQEEAARVAPPPSLNEGDRAKEGAAAAPPLPATTVPAQPAPAAGQGQGLTAAADATKVAAVLKATRKSKAAAMLEQAAAAEAVAPPPVPPAAPGAPVSNSASSIARGGEGSAAAAAPAHAPAAPAAAAGVQEALPAPYEEARARAVRTLLSLHASSPGEAGGVWKGTGVKEGVRMAVPAPGAPQPVLPPDAETGPLGANSAASETFVGGRGDALLPYSPWQALAYLWAYEGSRAELDSGLDKALPLPWPAGSTPSSARLLHMKFKGVFPTDPRDFCTLAGWHAVQAGEGEGVPPGSLLVYATSVVHPACPKGKGYVRGWLDIGGWVLSPLPAAEYSSAAHSLGLPPPSPLPSGTATACRVSYIFRTAIGGSVPAMLVQQVSAAQAKAPALLSKLLTARKGKLGGTLPSMEAAPPSTAAGAVEPGKEAAASASSGSSVEVAAGDAGGAAHSSSSCSGGATPPLNLSGTWKLDKGSSDSLEPLLVALDVPWVARKMVAGLDITTCISHSQGEGKGQGTLAITEMSSLGNNASTQVLDWTERKVGGGEAGGGAVTLQKAVALPCVDGCPGTEGAALGGPAPDYEGAIAAYRAAAPPVAPPWPRFGPGSGCVVSLSSQPAGPGSFLDCRTLASPHRLRLQSLFINKEGVVKAKLTRYYNRVLVQPGSGPGSAPGQWVAPPPALVGDGGGGQAQVVGADGYTVEEREVVQGRKGTAAPAAAPGGQSESESEETLQSPVLPPPPPPALGTQPTLPSSPYHYARWQPDEEGKECPLCALPFLASTFALRRKHHCRTCGLVVCDACSAARCPPVHWHPEALRRAKLAVDAPVRTCNTCAQPVILSAKPVEVEEGEGGGGTLPSSGGAVLLTGGNLPSEEQARAGKVRVRVARLKRGGGAGQEEVQWVELKASAVKVVKAYSCLSVTLPPGLGLMRLEVSVEGRCGPHSTACLAYTPPVLHSLQPLDTDGGIAVLRGENVGGGSPAEDALSWSFSLHCGPGSPPLPVPVHRWISPHRQVMLRVPPRTGPGPWVIKAAVDGRVLAGAEIPVAWHPPHIFGVQLPSRSPSPPPGRGGKAVEEEPRMLIYGTSFGSDPSAIRVSVKLPRDGSVHPCPDVTLAVCHTKIMAALPAALAAKLQAGCALTVSVGQEEVGYVLPAQEEEA